MNFQKRKPLKNAPLSSCLFLNVQVANIFWSKQVKRRWSYFLTTKIKKAYTQRDAFLIAENNLLFKLQRI